MGSDFNYHPTGWTLLITTPDTAACSIVTNYDHTRVELEKPFKIQVQQYQSQLSSSIPNSQWSMVKYQLSSSYPNVWCFKCIKIQCVSSISNVPISCVSISNVSISIVSMSSISISNISFSYLSSLKESS